MERQVAKYQPIITIHLEDDAFGTRRLHISPQELTQLKIDKHPSLEKNEPSRYTLALITQEIAEHKSLEDKLEVDYTLKEKVEQHSQVIYDYSKQNEEYTREIFLPVADAATVTEDLTEHIFENALLLKFSVLINPLLKASLLSEDSNQSKLVFVDDIMTPSASVREKYIAITPIEENGNLKWQIEEEGKASVDRTTLNLDDGILAECHVTIPAHLTNIHSISYHIHIKRKTINNP